MITALLIAASLAATAETAPAVIARAQPGDTIALSGTIPSVVVLKRSGLTFDASAATIGNIMIRDSSDIVVKGGAYRPTTWAGAIMVQGSKKVRITGISTMDTGKFNGVTFRDSTDVLLEGARLDRPAVGVNILHVTGAQVSNVALIGVAVDGIDIASSHDVTAEYNVCAGNLLLDDRHPDCIQMWSIKGEPPTSNVTLRYNMAYGPTQGFDGFDHDMGGFDNITIENNTAIISYSQGVAINNARNSRVRNNIVRTLPGSRFRASINVEGIPSCGNYAALGAGQPEQRDPSCH